MVQNGKKTAFDLIRWYLERQEDEDRPFREMAETDIKKAYLLHERSKSSLELDEDIQTRLGNILKKLYPSQFKLISEFKKIQN